MQTRRRNSFIGSASLIVSASIWGLAFIAQRSAANNRIGAIAFNGMRFVQAAVVLGIVYVVFALIEKKRGIKSVGWNNETLYGGVLCGIALFIAANMQQVGIASTTVGKASFITAMYIVFVPVLGLLTGRKPSILSAGAILLAVVGFALISGIFSGFSLAAGDAYVLLSAVMFAVQILFVDIFAKDTDPIKLTLVQFATCAVISIPAMGIVGFPSAETISANVWELLYMGVLSAGVGFTTQTIGQRYVEPSIATMIMSLEAVIGIFGGTVILHENHTALELAGCVIVLIAVFMAQVELPHTLLRFDKNKFAQTSKRRA